MILKIRKIQEWMKPLRVSKALWLILCDNVTARREVGQVMEAGKTRKRTSCRSGGALPNIFSLGMSFLGYRTSVHGSKSFSLHRFSLTLGGHGLAGTHSRHRTRSSTTDVGLSWPTGQWPLCLPSHNKTEQFSGYLRRYFFCLVIRKLNTKGVSVMWKCLFCGFKALWPLYQGTFLQAMTLAHFTAVIVYTTGPWKTINNMQYPLRPGWTKPLFKRSNR